MSFLTAEWRKLALANYEVDPKILQPFLPSGVELDPWKGKHYVSLVGFMFVNTKVIGIKIPFHTNFEEVNLRFYVRRKVDGDWRRGVVFIKEIVPRHAITLIANTLYKEHYETQKMGHQWSFDQNTITVSYNWWHGKNKQSLKVIGKTPAQPIPKKSEEEFITEHYFGYTKVAPAKTFEYEVTHPRWLCYPVSTYTLDIDFGLVYGDAFQWLNHANPNSVMLAEGSQITVENKTQLP